MSPPQVSPYPFQSPEVRDIIEHLTLEEVVAFDVLTNKQSESSVSGRLLGSGWAKILVLMLLFAVIKGFLSHHSFAVTLPMAVLVGGMIGTLSASNQISEC